MSKRPLNAQKIPLEVLLNILMELYENGADYVDLSSDNSTPGQDKVIITTRDEYFSPDFPHPSDDEDEDEDDEDDDDPPKREHPFVRRTTTDETTKLSEDDLNGLL